MGKAVLISIRPEWVEKILSGEKTLEVRKNRPNMETPFKCYIYCTKASVKYQTICGCHVLNSDELYRHPEQGIKYGDSIELMLCENYTKDNFLNGKVVGEFTCDRIYEIRKRGIPENFDYCYLSLNEWGNDDIETEIRAISASCVSKEELNAYGAKAPLLYGWHISNLKIYDAPKELTEFHTWKKCKSCSKSGYESTACIYDENCMVPVAITKAPQSWCYVEELNNG